MGRQFFLHAVAAALFASRTFRWACSPILLQKLSMLLTLIFLFSVPPVAVSKAINSSAIVIEPIELPQKYHTAGLTGVAVATELKREANRFASEVRELAKSSPWLSEANLSEITIGANANLASENSAASRNALSALLARSKQALGITQNHLVGRITETTTGFSLRLQDVDNPSIAPVELGTRSTVEQLLREFGGYAFLRTVKPSVIAVRAYELFKIPNQNPSAREEKYRELMGELTYCKSYPLNSVRRLALR